MRRAIRADLPCSILGQEGHFGPVTSLDLHPSVVDEQGRPSQELSQLMLSAGLDWTVKLWHLEHSSPPTCVKVFDVGDFVHDVKWCAL